MATIWILIAMSTSSGAYGVTTAIEFNNQQACIQAREIMKQNGMTNPNTICVPKNGTAK